MGVTLSKTQENHPSPLQTHAKLISNPPKEPDLYSELDSPIGELPSTQFSQFDEKSLTVYVPSRKIGKILIQHAQTSLKSCLLRNYYLRTCTIELLDHNYYFQARHSRKAVSGAEYLDLRPNRAKLVRKATVTSCVSTWRSLPIDLAIMKEKLKAMAALKKMWIYLSDNKIEDDKINYLANSLSSLKSIRSLNLCISSINPLSRRSLARLRDGIRVHKALKTLIIRLYNTPEVGFHCLKEGIKRLVKLRSLSITNTSLDNEGLQETHAGVIHLSEALRMFSNLRRLDLSLQFDKNLSTDLIEYFGYVLQHLTSLNYLRLDFSHSNSLMDKGLRYVTLGIRGLKNLQTLHLNLSGATSITNEGIKCIKNAIQRSAIKELTLHLSKLKLLTDESLSVLADGIRDTKALNKLFLDLSYGLNFTDLGFSYLREAIKTLKTLDWLYLKLTACAGISVDAIKSLEKDLKINRCRIDTKSN